MGKQHLVQVRGIEHLDKHTGDRWKLHADPVYISGGQREDHLSDSIGLCPRHAAVPPRGSVSVVSSLKRIVCSAAGCRGGILSCTRELDGEGPEGSFWVHADGIIMRGWQI